LLKFYSYSYDQSIDEGIDNYSKEDQKNSSLEDSQRSELDEIYHPEMPFISNVSNFIRVKKKNLERLENKRNSVSSDIVVLEKQRTEKTSTKQGH
jgi:hypothetical protein